MDFRTCLLAFLMLSNLMAFVSAQQNDYWCFDANGNYTTNSTYHTNLNNLLQSLPENMGDSGFYNGSLGKGPDRVNAIAFCRGDTQPDACRSCLKMAAARIVATCPNLKHASAWPRYNSCMIRYSNDDTIFGSWERSAEPAITFFTGNVSSPDKFNEKLHKMLDDFGSQAAKGGSLMKVAAGNMSGPDFQTIFVYLQCTPDLSETVCLNCLLHSASFIASCCLNTMWYNSVAPSCFLEYKTELAYNITRIYEAQQKLNITLVPPPAPEHVLVPPSNRPPPPGKRKNNTARTIAIIVFPVILALISIACFGVWITKRSNKKPVETLESTNEISTPAESLRYEFNEIREATDNFSDANKLGQGGFGAVYKGKLLNGQEIAVKRLFRGSVQGDMEFKNEVMLLAKLQHRNLVRLVGFAHEGIERVLIYEFIQNASLDHFIFDRAKAYSIDWNMRLKIISGIARGLLYLHEDSRLRIIHRDLKPSNILLDESMNPKIADFGIARLFEHDESQVSTSRIVGTQGYMSPEYAFHGHFSIKSDVFSFGVLVLEIISGQKSYIIQKRTTTIEEGLLNFAWRNWCDGTVTNMIDPILQSTPSCFHEIIKCVHIALLCVQENAIDRPTTASVVLMLSSFMVTLPTPAKPAFLVSQSSSPNASALHET